MKLAEIELIYSEIGEYPILLLDDVLSELDDYRQSHLFNTIQGKVQTFVTTTSVEGIDHQTLKEAATYKVECWRNVENPMRWSQCICMLVKKSYVRTKDIIAILDIDSVSSSPYMEDFIETPGSEDRSI